MQNDPFYKSEVVFDEEQMASLPLDDQNEPSLVEEFNEDGQTDNSYALLGESENDFSCFMETNPVDLTEFVSLCARGAFIFAGKHNFFPSPQKNVSLCF